MIYMKSLRSYKMKRLLILIMFTITGTAYSEVDCGKHKIYCHIKQVRPDMKTREAMKLSNLIYKYSKKYKTDPHLSVAIGMQESSLVNQNRKVKGMIKTENGFQLVEVYTDVGLFQMHYNTIIMRELDMNRLQSDLEYNVDQHVKLLSEKIDFCSKRYPDTAWACYHSSTKKNHIKYVKLVTRYFYKEAGGLNFNIEVR